MNFRATDPARILRATISALLGTTALVVTAPVTQAQTLEEVLVTAQRRQTDLQTTPVAISAYTRRGTRREQDLHRQRPGCERPCVLAHCPVAARRGTEHSRHHQHSTGLADCGPLRRHVRRRRVHGPHWRPELRLLRPRAHRGDPRPAGRAARQERRGRRAQRDHGQAFVRGFRQRARLLRQLQFHPGLRTHQRRPQRYPGGTVLVPGPSADGYAEDILHNRDVEDLESIQARVQLLWAPRDSAWRGRWRLDYNKDETNGINTVAVDGGTPSCETSYLRTNCTRPWSNLRHYLGLTDPRQDVAQSVQFQGEDRIQQFMERDGFGAILDIEKKVTASRSTH